MKNLYKSVLIVLALSGTFIAKSQVNNLNSFSTASSVIYLDFDGHAVSGTMWNISGAFTCNSSGLSDVAITEVFNRVAEDYRPFNINVTTDPAKYTSAPFNKRMRVVITTSHEWYSSSAGGVAYVNSFTWGDNTPCFVFSGLHNFNAKNIAEAASHEAGHTLGLRHQSSYNSSGVKFIPLFDTSITCFITRSSASISQVNECMSPSNLPRNSRRRMGNISESVYKACNE